MQADLNLRWAHVSVSTFPEVAAQLPFIPHRVRILHLSNCKMRPAGQEYADLFRDLPLNFILCKFSGLKYWIMTGLRLLITLMYPLTADSLEIKKTDWYPPNIF